MIAAIAIYAASAVAGTLTVPVGITENNHYIHQMYADVKLGSQDQSSKMSLSTFYNAAIFNGEGSTCQVSLTSCKVFEVFDYEDSDSFTEESEFKTDPLSYEDIMEGIMGKDTVKFGGTSIDELEIAIALKNSVYDLNFLGLGPASDDSDSPSFIQQLQNKNIIDRQMYSFISNGNDSSILFGGIDHGKYSGELKEFDLSVEDNEDIFSTDFNFDAEVTFLMLNSSNSLSNTTVVQTSISTFGDSVLPSGFLSILQQFIDPGETYGLSCSHISNTDLFISIGGINATIPLLEFIYYTLESEDECAIALSEGYDGDGLALGNIILRYFYTVVDYDSKTVSFARSQVNGTSDIEEGAAVSGSSRLDVSSAKSLDSPSASKTSSGTSSDAESSTAPNSSVSSEAASTSSKTSSDTAASSVSSMFLAIAALVLLF